MKMKYTAYIAGLLLALSTAACNDDSSAPIVIDNTTGAYSVIVNSFSLEANDSVMSNLDSVFFAIDLDHGRIFNADSLPKDTKVDELVVKIGLPTLLEAKLYVPKANSAQCDTIDYLLDSTEPVNFANGPVTLHLVSANGEVSLDYEIKVNVHKVDPSLMVWAQTAQSTLPTSLSSVTSQGVVEIDGKTLCFTTDGSAFSRAVTDNPYAGNWTVASVTMPSGAKVETITAAGSSLYMIAAGDALYSSSDLGVSWSNTGASMSHIYGANGDNLLGAKANGDGTYVHVVYPSLEESALAAGFPVSGTSQALQFVTEWATDPMTFIAGGITASGEYCGSVWAYDGTEWAQVSNVGFPAMTGVTLVPYFTKRVEGKWQVTDATALLILGGKTADGSVNDSTYVSRDRGVNWARNTVLQLPEEITPFYGAQAVVSTHTFSDAATASVWSDVAPRKLPAWYAPLLVADSRATKPIEEWECPFIYLFGGYDAQGNLNDKIWRGVINRLTFKPLQ